MNSYFHAKLIVSGRDTEYQEIQLKFQKCKWQFLGCDKEKDIIMRETPDILFKVADFMQAEEKWSGSATELLNELNNTDTPSNTVTKILNQYHQTFLLENHINYKYKRTSYGRLITLTKISCCGDLPISK